MSEQNEMDVRNAEAKRLIARLVELKAKVGEIVGGEMSDNDFAKKFLTFSATTWSKLQSGSYNGGKLFSMEQDMRDSINEIEGRLDGLREAASYSKTFINTSFVSAVAGRVKRAKDDPEDRRIVVCLAPTGFGKTAMVKYLVGKGAVAVEGLQSWKSSYRSFCASIAQACGTEVPLSATQDRAEELMLKARSNRDGTRVIDEANTLSGPCANGIKQIVNRTGYTVVLAAIPEFWDKFLEGNRGEVRQIINRCQRVIRQEEISVEDVKKFLKSRSLPLEFASDIAKVANRFGGFRTVISIMDEIKADPTREGLEKSISEHGRNYAAFNLGK